MNDPEENWRAWLKVIRGVGILFACGPLIGLALTAYFMARASAQLREHGIGDPGKLSQAIGGTLVSSAIGFLLLPVGIIMIVAASRALRPPELSALEQIPPPLPPPE